MSTRQLDEWEAYSRLEPFGEERADLRAAQICQVLANINRDPKKHPAAFKTADFMFDFDQEQPKAQPWQEQLAMLKLLSGKS